MMHGLMKDSAVLGVAKRLKPSKRQPYSDAFWWFIAHKLYAVYQRHQLKKQKVAKIRKV